MAQAKNTVAQDEAVLKATQANTEDAVAKHDLPAERVVTEDGVTGINTHSTQVNTTASMKGKGKTNAQLAEDTKKLQRNFKDAKKVKVSIPSVLEAQLGKNMFVGINGVSITIPVDGEEYEVPEPFAQHVKQTLKNLK